MFFRPTATVDRVEISRAFAVTSEATVLRTARRDEAALELESVAAAEVGQRYRRSPRTPKRQSLRATSRFARS